MRLELKEDNEQIIRMQRAVQISKQSTSFGPAAKEILKTPRGMLEHLKEQLSKSGTFLLNHLVMFTAPQSPL